VTEADNLTAALEWCRQQGQYDLGARIAVRMAVYWGSFLRHSEMTAWGRDLDAGLPADDRDHRAMALLLRGGMRSRAEWEELNVCSAQASALADPHSWVAAQAQYLQAVYWSVIDPPKADPFFERALELWANLGIRPDPVYYQNLYLSRLVRAKGSEEALAVLNDWRADVGDSRAVTEIAGAFALYGDTQTALELRSRAVQPGGVPSARVVVESSEALLASALGQFDEAEQHLVTLTSIRRDIAIPYGDASTLILFAKVAVDRGDYARASRLLAPINSSVGPDDRPLMGPMGALIYGQCTRVLEALDQETARATQVEGSALSVKEALDAELARVRTTARANPAD
jgi:tetratricopeptide (TPR) repeat protein